jgi:hypothetical protein
MQIRYEFPSDRGDPQPRFTEKGFPPYPPPVAAYNSADHRRDLTRFRRPRHHCFPDSYPLEILTLASCQNSDGAWPTVG